MRKNGRLGITEFSKLRMEMEAILMELFPNYYRIWKFYSDIQFSSRINQHNIYQT